ncbi:hypothetical protein RSO01_68900 [Reyranella soli]|uniref:Uncharacterized protein n=1 Tax=Reyranella soli TaxID=1230389 RepID=A0A512NLA1_9HYPH|nr:hypothetical protein RSO01_68900 [Reyranella soli]
MILRNSQTGFKTGKGDLRKDPGNDHFRLNGRNHHLFLGSLALRALEPEMTDCLPQDRHPVRWIGDKGRPLIRVDYRGRPNQPWLFPALRIS